MALVPRPIRKEAAADISSLASPSLELSRRPQPRLHLDPYRELARVSGRSCSAIYPWLWTLQYWSFFSSRVASGIAHATGPVASAVFSSSLQADPLLALYSAANCEPGGIAIQVALLTICRASRHGCLDCPSRHRSRAPSVYMSFTTDIHYLVHAHVASL
jgi:hypothetical protein